jgi:glutathione synthase/RimK-type ligase-like ATP-grasp enzyme
MSNASNPACCVQAGSDPEHLNQFCFCITLDHRDLAKALDLASGESGLHDRIAASHPHLFSNVPVFLPARALQEMTDTVEAIEEVAAIPAFRDTVLGWATAIAHPDHGPQGALMGYDFHLGDDGPKLIEVNTNAGGAFLNALLARAQTQCCVGRVLVADDSLVARFEAQVIAMFRSEWQRQRGAASLRRIAIVDDAPTDQYLYPEFVLAQQMLARHGIDAVICDPQALTLGDVGLSVGDLPVDLVYNRLVDFTLSEPRHAALRDAYQRGAVVLTPNPHNHALLAHKRNLVLLSDPSALAALGVEPTLADRLRAVPQTRLVTPQNAEELWQTRRQLFFKPVAGHGGKAVYRGDKLTKSVWAEIVSSDYVAQELVTPGQRMIQIDGVPTARKVDLRLYTYAAKPLLVAARIYQGQTTNFRTPGGGFAPVLIV